MTIEMKLQEKLEEGIELGEKRGIELGEKRGIELGEKRGEKRGIELGEKRGEKRGIELGEKRGIELGERKKSLEIARELFGMGIDVAQVSKATGLSVEELAQL